MGAARGICEEGKTLQSRWKQFPDYFSLLWTAPPVVSVYLQVRGLGRTAVRLPPAAKRPSTLAGRLARVVAEGQPPAADCLPPVACRRPLPFRRWQQLADNWQTANRQLTDN